MQRAVMAILAALAVATSVSGCGGTRPKREAVPSPTNPPEATSEPTPTPTLLPTETPPPIPTSVPSPTPSPTATPTPSDVPLVIEIQEVPDGLHARTQIAIPLKIFDWDGDDIQVDVQQQLGMGDKYTGSDYVTAQRLKQLSLEEDKLLVRARFPGNYRVLIRATDKHGTTEQALDLPVTWAPGENPLETRGLVITTFGPREWNKLDVVPDLIDYIRSIDGNSVQFAIWWNQSTVSGSDIHRCTAEDGCVTPTDAQLISWIEYAHTHGMSVLVKPHLVVGDWSFDEVGYDAESWQIQPNDPEEWFGNYQSMIDHYAGISQDTGAEMFFVGNELNNTQAEFSLWSRAIDSVRSTYGGLIGYSDVALWHPDWKFVSPFWDQLDLMGLPFYYPGSQGDLDPSVEEMVNYFRPQLQGNLRQAIEQSGTRVLVSEIGRPSFDGANVSHAIWSETADKQEQVDYFEAAFRVMGEDIPVQGNAKGVYVWALQAKTFLQDIDWDCRDKPLEKALELWWSD